MLFCALLSLLVLCHTAQAQDKDVECIVVEKQEFQAPLNTSILSFITPEQPITTFLSFHDHDSTYCRDAMELSSSAFVRYNVRDGKSSKIGHLLPISVPEGWNRLRIKVNDTNLKLELITDNEQVTLINEILDFTADIISLRGNFSVCSRVSLGWKVKVDQQVAVPLQPQKREQRLVVTGQNTSRPYLVNFFEPHNNYSVSADATLKVMTQRNGSGTTIYITQENKESKPYHMKQPSLQPVIVVGSEGGNTQLRLDLSDPHKEEEPHKKEESRPHGFFINKVVLGLIMVLITTNVILACLLWREKNKPHPTRRHEDKNLLSGKKYGKIERTPDKPSGKQDHSPARTANTSKGNATIISINDSPEIRRKVTPPSTNNQQGNKHLSSEHPEEGEREPIIQRERPRVLQKPALTTSRQFPPAKNITHIHM